MPQRKSADKVILLTLIDLLLQLLFLFLFMVLVVSQTSLSSTDWAAWKQVKDAMAKFGVSAPSFAPTWQAGQAALKREHEAAVASASKAGEDIKKPFNVPCVSSTDAGEGALKRVYIARFFIGDEGISAAPSGTTIDNARFKEGVALLDAQIKASGKTIWSALEFRATFQPFRDKDCEYYARIEKKMESNDLSKYLTFVSAIRYAFGPDRYQ